MDYNLIERFMGFIFCLYGCNSSRNGVFFLINTTFSVTSLTIETYILFYEVFIAEKRDDFLLSARIFINSIISISSTLQCWRLRSKLYLIMKDVGRVNTNPKSDLPSIAIIMPFIYYISYMLCYSFFYDVNHSEEIGFAKYFKGLNKEYGSLKFFVSEFMFRLSFFRDFYSIAIYYFIIDVLVNAAATRIDMAFRHDSGSIDIKNIVENMNYSLYYIRFINRNLSILPLQFYCYSFGEIFQHINMLVFQDLNHLRKVICFTHLAVKIYWLVLFSTKISTKYEMFKALFHRYKICFLISLDSRINRIAGMVSLFESQFPKFLSIGRVGNIKKSILLGFSFQVFTFYFMFLNHDDTTRRYKVFNYIV